MLRTSHVCMAPESHAGGSYFNFVAQKSANSSKTAARSFFSTVGNDTAKLNIIEVQTVRLDRPIFSACKTQVPTSSLSVDFLSGLRESNCMKIAETALAFFQHQRHTTAVARHNLAKKLAACVRASDHHRRTCVPPNINLLASSGRLSSTIHNLQICNLLL